MTTYRNKTWDYIEEFTEALKCQLQLDDTKWGDTWKKRIIGGQETRIFNDIQNYRDQFENANKPVPWLKVAGLALIAWIREKEANNEEV